MKEISVLGIDLAKDVFQLHGIDKNGKVVLKKKLRRSELKEFIVNLNLCLIGMEACSGSHYWARAFQQMGHQVRLVAAQFVKPYVKSNKNDAVDAEAIVEAVTRPSMRFVAVKQDWQQDIQNLHRIRQRLVRGRTALSNEIRGLLQEYGFVLPKSISKLKSLLPPILDDQTKPLTFQSRRIFTQLLEELKMIESEISKYDLEIQQIFKTNEAAQRIEKIEGVGALTATAIVAAVGDPRVFENGRQFAAWLGLVPRQNSSGGKTQLLGISKRGDVYLRCLLIHGARAALRFVPLKSDRKSRWATEKIKTRGYNRASVALANKNARVIWAIMARGEEYKIVV